MWPGRLRPNMSNSVLEGLRDRRLDDLLWKIWFTTLSSCANEVGEELEVKDKYEVVCNLHT